LEEIEINKYLAEQDIFALFCMQLKKDFEGAGAALSLSEGIKHEATQVREIILAAVKHITRQSSHQLPSLLYRIDISENKLKDFADKHKELGFEEVVAELIVRRILQKVILKKRFSNG
jgi:hypothetical protein